MRYESMLSQWNSAMKLKNKVSNKKGKQWLSGLITITVGFIRLITCHQYSYSGCALNAVIIPRREKQNSKEMKT